MAFPDSFGNAVTMHNDASSQLPKNVGDALFNVSLGHFRGKRTRHSIRNGHGGTCQGPNNVKNCYCRLDFMSELTFAPKNPEGSFLLILRDLQSFSFLFRDVQALYKNSTF